MSNDKLIALPHLEEIQRVWDIYVQAEKSGVFPHYETSGIFKGLELQLSDCGYYRLISEEGSSLFERESEIGDGLIAIVLSDDIERNVVCMAKDVKMARQIYDVLTFIQKGFLDCFKENGVFVGRTFIPFGLIGAGLVLIGGQSMQFYGIHYNPLRDSSVVLGTFTGIGTALVGVLSGIERCINKYELSKLTKISSSINVFLEVQGFKSFRGVDAFDLLIHNEAYGYEAAVRCLETGLIEAPQQAL